MYDYLFISHLPSFYKVNLYNRLAERLRIYVVFVASSSVIRTDDFIGKKLAFDHEILHHGDLESRPLFSNIIKLLNILSAIQFNKIVVGGWDLWEFWTAIIVNKKCRNALVLESTVTESSTAGIKSVMKRFFVSRIGTAFPSGRLHQQLLQALGFNGVCYFTKGVGIFNRQSGPKSSREFTASFLYVGRLSPEKNLRLLVEAFNELPHLKLTIVGSGPMERELKQIARGNIVFRSHVVNPEIADVYTSHDIFVLPSLREPWGLVVEEALFYGLPVLVSQHVGCHTELVAAERTGLTFDPHCKKSLIEAVQRAAVPKIYHQMKQCISALDFAKKDEEQLMAYMQGCQSVSPGRQWQER